MVNEQEVPVTPENKEIRESQLNRLEERQVEIRM